MKFLIANALSFACLAAMIAVGIILYPGLPETIATQYNLEGIPGNYMSKQVVVLIMPLSYAFTIAVINFMIHFSPSKFSMPNSQRAMDIIVFGTGIILLSSHVGLLVSLGDSDIFQQYLSLGLACFLILTGNVVGKTERNFIIGIRLPWTIASEQNWRATHRLSGRLMVLSGLVLLVAGYYWPSLLVTLGVSLSWLLIAATYSFWYYLKNERTS